MDLGELLRDVWMKYIVGPISQFSIPADILDILLLTMLCYWLYTFAKGRRAGKLVIGVVLVAVSYVLSDILNMHIFNRIISAVASVGVIIIVIIFQPELRDVLEKLGSTPFGFKGVNDKERFEVNNTINAVVDAAIMIAQEEADGALIVIERTTKLGDYIDTGHTLNADVSVSLLRNIFVNRSPLHDGAVVISDNRIAAAGCKLPLATNEEDLKGLGTRHRAAVGITEYCNDCVVVVVSEERHRISVANGGVIKLDYNKNVADLRAEESVKVIRNALRQDLYHMLTDVTLEEVSRYEAKKAEKERERALREAKRRQKQAEKQIKRRKRMADAPMNQRHYETAASVESLKDD